MEKERPYPMEKCANFRRVITPTKQEKDFCTETGNSMHCAGWSDLCPIFEKFKPIEKKIIDMNH